MGVSHRRKPGDSDRGAVWYATLHADESDNAHTQSAASIPKHHTLAARVRTADQAG